MSDSTIAIFFRWFFVTAPGQIIEIGRNFLAWAWHFFSIGFFLPRLFAPWHRDISGYGRGFDLERFLRVLGWNIISRVLGAIMRSFIILLGLTVEAIAGLCIFLVFVFWLLSPFISATLLISGLITIFT